ncbi:MobA/MobL family protein [Luteimonas sp. A649]
MPQGQWGQEPHGAASAGELVADTKNQVLAQHGHEARVDHRSLRDQGLQRRAERHLGPRFIEGMAPAERARYAAFRTGTADGGTAS